MSGSRIFLIQYLRDACVGKLHAAGFIRLDQRNLDAPLLASRLGLRNGGIRNGHGSPFRQWRAVLQDHYAVLYSTGNDHSVIICQSAIRSKCKCDSVSVGIRQSNPFVIGWTESRGGFLTVLSSPMPIFGSLTAQGRRVT
jgi:hypothetical protein